MPDNEMMAEYRSLQEQKYMAMLEKMRELLQEKENILIKLLIARVRQLHLIDEERESR